MGVHVTATAICRNGTAARPRRCSTPSKPPSSGISIALVEEQLSCRQITKRLNAAKTPTPTGKNAVWQHATVRNILANRTYTGQARYNYRQPVLPQARKTEEHRLQYLKTGRRYRAESEWVWSDAPAIISVELLTKRNCNCSAMRPAPARCTGRRHAGICCARSSNAASAGGHGVHPPTERPQKYEYLYYACKGYSPLSVGRTTKCHAKLMRADRLDTLVWHALEQLLHQPSVIPQLHQTWVEAKQHTLSGLEAQQAQLLQRRQRIERQDQRLLMPIRPRFSTCRSCKHGGRTRCGVAPDCPGKPALSPHAATKHPLATSHGQ